MPARSTSPISPTRPISPIGPISDLQTCRPTPAPQAARAAAKRAAARRLAWQRRQPRLSRLLAWLLSAVLGSAGLAHAQVPASALPAGGTVVVGAGQVQRSNNLLIVNQASQRLGMDWQSFNIGSSEIGRASCRERV